MGGIPCTTRHATVGRIRGIPIRIDATWLIIAGFVLWSLSAVAFPLFFVGYGRAVYWTMGTAATAGLFVSILLHELAHAAVARRFDTPVEGITLFLLGGVAEMSEEPRTARAEFLMAGAGPAASLALGGLGFILTGLGTGLGWPETVNGTLGYLAVVNLLLAVFNLVPAFPLDGGRMLRAVLWGTLGSHGRATRVSVYMGVGLGWIGVALGLVTALFGSPLAGVWWVMVGLFVQAASRTAWKRMLEDEEEEEAAAAVAESPGPAPGAESPESSHVPDPAEPSPPPAPDAASRPAAPHLRRRPPRPMVGVPARIKPRAGTGRPQHDGGRTPP
jgi:Zn-dependent protease